VANLLAKLRAMNGPVGLEAYRKGPGSSKDLARIVALPRRVQPNATEMEALAEKWTAHLSRREGTMTLRPIQAVALEEALAAGGLMGLLGVGWGKTILSLLLPTVWGASVSALLIPPNLKTKLFELEYPQLARHWKLPNLVGHPLQFPDSKGVLHVVTYSDLSSSKRADILERLQPDAVICDEAHSLRYASAARTKRFKRYFRMARAKSRSASQDVVEGNSGVLRDGFDPGNQSASRRGGGVKLAVLSGTLTSRGINDYAHLSALALGAGSPLPLDWHTLQEWSFTLDPGVLPAAPGELRRLCSAGEDVRSGFKRRVIETPGVVATADNDPGMSLVFSRAELTAPSSVLKALQHVRDTWERPDGEVLRQAVEVYAVTRQLSCGFYYRRTFPHGEPKELISEWLQARREYFSEVREELKLSRPGLDSPLLLWNAAAQGEWKSECWERWSKLRNRVKPEKETVWVDRFLVEAAIEWAAEKPGILWVEAEAVKAAFEIAQGAGIPVYTGGKEDESALIMETGKRSVVAGIKAFGTGVNLQMFNRVLVTTCPASGALLEQVIGRSHRPGQEADEVQVDFYLHTPELCAAMAEAKSKAAYIEETTGNRQKLNLGTWLF